MYQPHQLGKWGEDKACEFLQSKGYKIIERNFKCRIGKRFLGEIDIIANKGRDLIFVEVKTIEQKEGFSPEDEIDFKKTRKLLRLSRFYLTKKKISFDAPRQIDIVAIEETAGQPIIRHYPNAIEDNF